MKELSIEEKAKAYDEAIKRAKQLSKELTVDDIIEQIFPELKESEDERIRKALLNEFIHLQSKGYKFAGLEGEDILAWFEKQGEQSHYGQREECLDCQVNYAGECKGSCAMKRGKQNLANSAKTCKDEQKPVIEMITPEESLGVDSDTYNKIVDECIYGEQKPTELPKGEDYGIDGLYAAIDILQKTLGKVDGYQSDDGILEHKCAINAVKELYEQKPAWSEEDCNQIEIIACHLDNIGNEAMAESLLNIMDKYKSCRPQNRWKPSDEQIMYIGEAIDLAEKSEKFSVVSVLKDIREQLKKLKQ